MIKQRRVSIVICMMLLWAFLAACQSQDDSPLPTLARIPTETQTPVDAAFARNTLPPTFTPTYTRTPTVTGTATDAPTTTGVPSLTPSPTITDTPSPTPTITLTPSPLPSIDPQDRPILGLLEYARQFTPLPSDFVIPNVTQPPNPANTGGTGTIILAPSGSNPTLPPPPSANSTLSFPTAMPNPPTCAIAPTGSFGTVYSANPAIAAQIGCALTPASTEVAAAWQNFQTGVMVWLNGEVYIFNSTTGTFSQFPDTFDAATDPETSLETAPAGLYIPVRGFLKIWDNNQAIRDSLGYGTIPEQGTSARVLQFQQGHMVELPGRQGILVLVGGVAGTWQNIIP